MTQRVREGQSGLAGASMSVDRHVMPGESVCGGDIYSVWIVCECGCGRRGVFVCVSTDTSRIP